MITFLRAKHIMNINATLIYNLIYRVNYKHNTAWVSYFLQTLAEMANVTPLNKTKSSPVLLSLKLKHVEINSGIFYLIYELHTVSCVRGVFVVTLKVLQKFKV